MIKRNKVLIGFLCGVVFMVLLGVANAEKYKVDLQVELNDLTGPTFPCSIKICVDDDELITTRCKDTYTTQIEIEEGRHTFGFSIANKGSRQELNVNISGNIKIKCRVNANERWPRLYLDRISPASAMIIPSRRESEGWHCNKCGKLSDLFFPDCVYCGNKKLGNKVILSFDFKENRIFSKYDVDVFVDNIHYSKLLHGSDSELNCRLSSGKHIIKLQKWDNNNIRVEKEVDISGDSLVNMNFDVNRKAINITDFKVAAKKADDHYVRFLNKNGVYTTGFSFNMDTGRFTKYSKTTPSHGKNDWSDNGTFTVDTSGRVTLMYDSGEIDYYRCEPVLDQHNSPEEALLWEDKFSYRIPAPQKLDRGAYLRQKN